MSEDDNVLVQGVAGDRDSLGYFGFAYYSGNKDKLKIVAIKNNDAPVAPSLKTINNGTYSPLSRPIFIYVSKKSVQRPEVAAFVEFYLKNADELSRDVGYVPLQKSQYDEGLQKLKRAMVKSERLAWDFPLITPVK